MGGRSRAPAFGNGSPGPSRSPAPALRRGLTTWGRSELCHSAGARGQAAGQAPLVQPLHPVQSLRVLTGGPVWVKGLGLRGKREVPSPGRTGCEGRPPQRASPDLGHSPAPHAAALCPERAPALVPLAASFSVTPAPSGGRVARGPRIPSLNRGRTMGRKATPDVLSEFAPSSSRDRPQAAASFTLASG